MLSKRFTSFAPASALTFSLAPLMRVLTIAPIIFAATLALIFLPIFGLSNRAVANDDFAKNVAPAFKKHCFKCHQGDSAEGDVDLAALRPDSLDANLDLIRDLIQVLDFEEMPPEDEPEMEPQQRKQLVDGLKRILEEELSKSPTFSQAPIRRMTRFQYNNAVTDLLDLKCIVFTLPERMMREHKNYFQPETGKMAQVVHVGNRPLGKSQMIEPRLAGVSAYPQDLRAEHGFDNQADHLSMSPLLMESFLKLGNSIVNSPDFTPKRVGLWKTFFKQPKSTVDKALIEKRLRPFLTKAFRRPVEQEVLNRYSSFVLNKIESGESFETAMKDVAAAIIASPKFFYLYDKKNFESKRRVDDFELASRLSFFLWGSIPDKTLLELATTGQLSKNEVLEQQIDRMLHDQKLKRFCDSFPAQWLQLDRLISSIPNREKYPSFYFAKYRTSMHMMLEPLLLFETVLLENQPITQLIDSDFTYRSGLLNKEYGNLKIDHKAPPKATPLAIPFHRMEVTDRRSGGILTNAATMTMTSGPEESKPITRGAWVAAVIFNNPPEPPPANVPELDEHPPADQKDMTLRERLDLHRERADCKGCHARIDPLGFALENYDAVGRWRDNYANERKVDMEGELFRKHAFGDVVEFKDAILREKDRFARGFAGHVLAYALGRQLDAADQLALNKIADETIKDDFKIQTLIKQVVFSEPFLNKANTETETPEN